MSLYPPKVQTQCDSPRHSGVAAGENAVGKDASFVCGSHVRFSVRVERETKVIDSAAFQSNGCGYMIAAADVLANEIIGKHLGDLHGLNAEELHFIIENQLGVFEAGRQHCIGCCVEALRSAFVDFKTRQIEEFSGEKALICTCFGVTEEVIDRNIQQLSLTTVDEVADVCNAGSGCGSCRMLIEEMLDGRSGDAFTR